MPHRSAELEHIRFAIRLPPPAAPVPFLRLVRSRKQRPLSEQREVLFPSISVRSPLLSHKRGEGYPQTVGQSPGGHGDVFQGPWLPVYQG